MPAMQIITDRARIMQVHADNAPREPMMAAEMYPDATIDDQGRAHAPHDGYSPDGVTAFNGGEYLPEDPEAGRRESVWRMALYDVAEHRGFDPELGAVFMLEGSPAQIKAVRAEAREQERAFDQAAGLALPEGRGEARLMLVSCWEKKCFHTGMPDQYGRLDYVLRDSDLNPVRYTGTSALADVERHVHGYPTRVPDLGRWIDLTASFTHYTSRKTGKVSVIMKRPSKIKRLAKRDSEFQRSGDSVHMDADDIRHATCLEDAIQREWTAQSHADWEENDRARNAA